MRISVIIVALLFIFSSACGGEAEENGELDASNGAHTESGLTQEQLEKGIGPVSEVSLGQIEEDLAEQGEETFKTKCSACHKMDERYVGPALGRVLEQRTPEYVMNMILNPEEMLQKHPEARALLAQFMTPMPNQQLTREEARAVLEYLREEGEEHEKEHE